MSVRIVNEAEGASNGQFEGMKEHESIAHWSGVEVPISFLFKMCLLLVSKLAIKI